MRNVRRGGPWALVFGAAIAAATAQGVRAEVRSIGLDQCASSCGQAAIGEATVGRDAAIVEITLSLCGGGRVDEGRQRNALVLDVAGAPALLADGLPSPIAPDHRVIAPIGALSPYFDLDAMIDGRRSGAPSAAAHVGQVTLTDFLSYLQAVFTTRAPSQRPAL